MSGPQPIGELLPESRPNQSRRRPSPDDVVLTGSEELTLELVHFGVSLRKAQSLVEQYPAERIRRQLSWLPRRSPRRPAPLLIASIEHDYDAPAYADER